MRAKIGTLSGGQHKRVLWLTPSSTPPVCSSWTSRPTAIDAETIVWPGRTPG
ncbi:MAG: hypothetical protein M5U34_26785 [Chloroflexi bacterium]|nr:hypothetical protein [Chloroflexota bacterium]